MPPSPDHQLGSSLRLRRPAGAANRQQLGGMIRDLVGGDESLLPPLQHLTARPAFLALDPQTDSRAQRLLGRDQLLAELADLYQPRVVERLRAFLDGYLDLPSATAAPTDPAPMIWGDAPPAAIPEPSTRLPARETPEARSHPAALPAAPPVASGAGASFNATAADAATGARSTAPGDAPHAGVGRAGDQPRSARPLPWILGLSVLAGLSIGIGTRLPVVCRPLGLCPASPAGSRAEATADSSVSSQSLDRARQVASALQRAGTLEALETALSDLERDLLRLSGDPLSPGQLQQREQLQAAARDGRQRLAEERQRAQTVAQAAGRIDALASLSAPQQASERQSLSQMLEAIPESSLAHAAAQEQLKRLNAPPAAPAEDASTPAAPGDPAATGTPATAPQPSRDPGWRSSPAGQGNDQGSGSAPGTSAPPAPQPAEDSGREAPHREDPLF
jgi:hypothetical protein